MKIWLINHYAVPPKYYPLARPSLFAKNLIRMGHDVTIIAASTVHNTDHCNLIEDGSAVKHITDDGIQYVLINCKPYKGNGMERVVNILQFAARLQKVLKRLDKADAIVATSFDPLTCYMGIKYAKKKSIKGIAEIADLWPETLVKYNGVSSRNIIVIILRCIEKSIYLNADKIVFTMAGAYKYIIEQGWEKELPEAKFEYINNGIDMEQFDFNRKHFVVDDEDLRDKSFFNVVYAGSIRKINGVGGLLDVAKCIANKRIRFLVWGDGDELDELKKRVKVEQIDNVVFKGKVEKKYIPYITSMANLNYAHNQPSPLFTYGISFNKIFDYLAAGKPILCDFPCDYNPVIDGNAGFEIRSANTHDIAKEIERIANMTEDELALYGKAARETAKKYDFKILASKLINMIYQIEK